MSESERKSGLWHRCRNFVDEQSCGEWDDKTIADDADLLMNFVNSERADLVAVLKDCLSDYAHPNFTDRHGMADRIRKVLADVAELPAEDREAVSTPKIMEAAPAADIAASKDAALPWSLNRHKFPNNKEISLLLNFANAYRDGAHGCQMDFETAQALSKAVLSMLATISHLKAAEPEENVNDRGLSL